jgi:hypothetical protein
MGRREGLGGRVVAFSSGTEGGLRVVYLFVALGVTSVLLSSCATPEKTMPPSPTPISTPSPATTARPAATAPHTPAASPTTSALPTSKEAVTQILKLDPAVGSVGQLVQLAGYISACGDAYAVYWDNEDRANTLSRGHATCTYVVVQFKVPATSVGKHTVLLLDEIDGTVGTATFEVTAGQ